VVGPPPGARTASGILRGIFKKSCVNPTTREKYDRYSLYVEAEVFTTADPQIGEPAIKLKGQSVTINWMPAGKDMEVIDLAPIRENPEGITPEGPDAGDGTGIDSDGHIGNGKEKRT
jgi:hypothetical protein